MSNILSTLKDLLNKKPVSLFISNSYRCPNYDLFLLNQNSKEANSILLIDTNSIDTINKLSKIRRTRNMMLYVHGNKVELKCFYRDLKNEVENDIFIENKWFKFVGKLQGNLYFHVCFGSQIIIQNEDLRKTFPNWVSYSNSVSSIHTSIPIIKEINRNLFNSISIAVSQRRNALALKNAVIGSYYFLKSDLVDIETARGVIGFTHLTMSVSENIRYLKCSS